MANKQRLQGLITTPTTPTEPAPNSGQTPAYPIGRLPQPDDLALPPQIGILSTALQVLAQKFIGARRRSGEALLEAARWLYDARTQAKHGEWGIFLEATGTSDDAAERLLNIHTLAMSDQRFADAVARNWLSQSVAADLARPSTPSEALQTLLDAEHPPSRADAQQAIKRARPGQNPHNADSVGSEVAEVQNPHNADFALQDQEVIGGNDLRQLQEAAAMLTALARRADGLPSGAATLRALEEAGAALRAIRRVLER